MKARFIRSDAMAERLGETDEVVVEAEWFQITYDLIRVAPDGDSIARYDQVQDAWYLDNAPSRQIAFSDVVIYTE